MARRSKVVRLLRAALIVCALMVVAAVALPMVINRGFLRGPIETAATKAVGAPVTIGTLGLSWFGPQVIQGVVVHDDAGDEATDLDLRVNGGLLGHLLGADAIGARVSGHVSAVVREDGTTSLDALLGGRDDGEPSTTAYRIALTDLDVDLTLPGDERVWLRRLHGAFNTAPGETTTFNLAGDVNAADRDGTLSAKGRASVDGAMEADVELANIGAPPSFPYRGTVVAIEQATIAFRTGGAAQARELTLKATTTLDSGASEPVEAFIAFEPGAPSAFRVNVDAVGIQAQAAGDLAEDGALTARDARLEASLGPALVQHWTGVDVESPIDAVITIAALTLPGPDDAGQRDLGRLAVDGRVELGATTVQRGGARVGVESIVIDLLATALGDAIEVNAVAVTDAGGVTIAERVRGLVADGNISMDAVRAEGRVFLQDLQLDRVAALAGADAVRERLAPFEVSTFTGAIDTTPTERGTDAEVRGELDLAASPLEVHAAMTDLESRRTLTALTIDGTIGPALVTALQPGVKRRDRYQLETDAPIRIALAAPVTLGGTDGTGGTEDAPMRLSATVGVRNAPIVVPGWAESVRVRDLEFTATLGDDEQRLRVDAGTLERAATGHTIGTVRSITAERVGERWRGEVAIGAIDASALGAVLGKPVAKAAPQDCVLAFEGAMVEITDGVEEGEEPLHAADGTMTATALPTALLDLAMESDGLVMAALGPTLDVRATARDLTRTSGQLDIEAMSAAARLTGRVNARENRLRSAASAPLTGSLDLTPELRSRLLAGIHPLLADVRTIEAPIRVELSKGFALPLDGDISRLNGDLEIHIGNVEFDSGSLMLSLLTAFQVDRPVVPGRFEPIEMRIRDGVVKTQRFVVHVDDDIELAFSGDVDLTKQTADLRTEIPLRALANAVEETRGFVDDVVIPIVYRGRLDRLRPEVDPEFDLAGATIQSTIDNALRDALQREVGSFDELLRKVLGGG